MIVNFSFLDGDVPHFPSYGVYILQLIRFARVRSNVSDFNNKAIGICLIFTDQVLWDIPDLPFAQNKDYHY